MPVRRSNGMPTSTVHPASDRLGRHDLGGQIRADALDHRVALSAGRLVGHRVTGCGDETCGLPILALVACSVTPSWVSAPRFRVCGTGPYSAASSAMVLHTNTASGVSGIPAASALTVTSMLWVEQPPSAKKSS